VLFKSDVEALIGKRPYEEKKALDIIVDPKEEISETPDTTMPEVLKTPPAI
jgi:AFG3 family protein